MVSRLLTDFRAETNRFESSNEALFVHLHGDLVVAVAGMNVEHETSFGRASRVRGLYVIPSCRHKGLARSLVAEIESLATSKYDTLTVNVGTLPVGGLYEHLGFRPVDHPRITHVKRVAHNNRLQARRKSRATEP